MSTAAQGETLATVLSSDLQACSLELLLYINENLAFFAGHFPEFPIVPGVAQLAWVVHFAQVYFNVEKPFTVVERLKFSSPILPGTQVKLTLGVNAQCTEINFRYHSESAVFSLGRLKHHAAGI